MDASTQAQGILSALFKGDYQSVVMMAMILAISQYGVFVVAYVVGKIRESIRWAQGKANEIDFLAGTTLDDRFFQLLDKAVANQVNVQAALAEAVADGTLDAADRSKLVEAIWADLRANLGISDLKGFALLLLGNSDAPGAERALRAKFDANVHAALGPIAATTTERRLNSRSLIRSMKGPTP